MALVYLLDVLYFKNINTSFKSPLIPFNFLHNFYKIHFLDKNFYLNSLHPDIIARIPYK